MIWQMITHIKIDDLTNDWSYLNWFIETMMRYNNIFLPFLGKYQVCQSYQFRTIIFASYWIHFMHFIIVDESNDFIADASTNRRISSYVDRQYRNGTIISKIYEDIIVNSWLWEVFLFITKLGVEIEHIDVSKAVHDVEENTKYYQSAEKLTRNDCTIIFKSDLNSHRPTFL